MKQLLVYFLLLMSSSGLLWAQESKSIKTAIAGADKPIPVGGIVDLSVSNIDKPDNAVSFSTDWIVFELPAGTERTFKFVREIDPSGAPITEGIVLGTGEVDGEWIVTCSMTYLLVTKEDDKITHVGTKTIPLRTRVTIGNGIKPNPPKPKPPGPDPVFPEGKYGLARKFYDICMLKVPAGENRQEGAKALVKSLRDTKMAIADKKLTGSVEILKKTTESNTAALRVAGIPLEEWRPAFLDLQDVLFDLYDKKLLETDKDFETALGEIADGTEKVTR